MAKKDDYKAPFELEKQSVSLYLLLDHKRNIYINPLPIDTEAHAIELFGQLLETTGTYAYKGYKRFDLYRLCTYHMGSGRVSQHGKAPRLICRGTKFFKE